MSLESDKKQEIELRKNQSIRTEIFIIELNNGTILRVSGGDEKITWGNDEYIPFPIKRGPSPQNEGQVVNQVPITVGDNGFALTRLILNDVSVIQKASVTIFQQIENTDGLGIIFRQIFKGVIVNVSGQLGAINFTVVEPYNDFSKPLNRKKFGEIPGVVDVSDRLF